MIAVLLMLATYAAPMPSVDRIEVNHYHDAKCKHVFTQLVFWDWSEQRRRYDIREWRLMKRETMQPRKINGRYVCRWTEDGCLREVTAASCSETWTQRDPELIEREYLSEEQRKPIFGTKP